MNWIFRRKTKDEPAADFEIGYATDPGRKRGGEPNQDAVGIEHPANGQNIPPLLIVADGMGGHAGGAEASRIVVNVLHEQYLVTTEILDAPAFLTECLEKARLALHDAVDKDPQLAGMGSAVVLALLYPKQVVVANVGDCRAYLIHGKKMTQVSMDQSVVAEQVRAGLLTPLQALHHPKRNRLTQSLNSMRETVKPFVKESRLKKKDAIVLCTDGLWSIISEAVIQAVVSEMAPQQAADKFVALTYARQSPDNISVIVVKKSVNKLHALPPNPNSF
jgi:serine/threonine protein phosphatase PrpC